jgi:integrase
MQNVSYISVMSIAEYLKSKQLAWAPTTLKSEGARLSAVEHVLDGDPTRLWELMEERKMKPYARLTTWIRVMNYWDFLVDSGKTSSNPYRSFRRRNARLFKHTYTPCKPTLSYEEAKARIESIEDPTIRRRALEMIGSGARWAESETHKDGTVVGKGGKSRQLYVPQVDGPEFIGTYQTFRRGLAKVGLKPHDLRKLFLTKLVELGANEFELMEAAGWSSMAPARSYINVNRDNLAARIKKIQEDK